MHVYVLSVWIRILCSVHLVCVINMYTIYEMYKDIASSCSSYAFSNAEAEFVVAGGQSEVALLPLVEMGIAPPIVTGYDMLRPII